MKNKNTILGILATIIATGSALAFDSPYSSEMYITAYVSPYDFEEGIATCINTSATCDNVSSGVRCAVWIPVQTTNALIITNKTYKDKYCTAQIYDNVLTGHLTMMAPVYCLAE